MSQKTDKGFYLFNKREGVLMLEEFKKFALKGNVLDLAVGVIIGGAFGKIVTSLVNDVIMPLLGVLIGGINFTDLKWVIKEGSEEVAEVAFLYGNFIQSIIDFLIISFSIFLFVKFINNFKHEKPEEIPAPPPPSKEEVLLTEIRDLLKAK